MSNSQYGLPLLDGCVVSRITEQRNSLIHVLCGKDEDGNAVAATEDLAIWKTGFGLAEVGTNALNRHWQRGAFPLSFLARTNEDSATWRQQFLQRFSNAMCRSPASTFRPWRYCVCRRIPRAGPHGKVTQWRKSSKCSGGKFAICCGLA
jgi:hypothetical protein